MFEASKHKELIELGGEIDLSQKNKAKLEVWRKAYAKNPRKCEVLRFMPSRKQFYNGGVRGVMWPGQTNYNTANGIPHVIPSDYYEIRKDGYCPKDEKEAIRLLFISQEPQNKICLFEDRELGDEARTSELNFQKLQSENARMMEEMEELKRKLEAKGGR